MNTLIIYASKHGTTEKCASLLSKKLAGKVDLYDIKAGTQPDLDSYDKVIIGSSIYVGKINKDINTFCLMNLDRLKEKKLGLFICCMNRNNAEQQLNSAFPQDLLQSASAKASFGGELNFSRMNFAERFITKMVTKSDPSLAAADGKKDLSMIIDENIDAFANKICVA